jgi:hypothetical protein
MQGRRALQSDPLHAATDALGHNSGLSIARAFEHDAELVAAKPTGHIDGEVTRTVTRATRDSLCGWLVVCAGER